MHSMSKLAIAAILVVSTANVALAQNKSRGSAQGAKRTQTPPATATDPYGERPRSPGADPCSQRPFALGCDKRGFW